MGGMIWWVRSRIRGAGRFVEEGDTAGVLLQFSKYFANVVERVEGLNVVGRILIFVVFWSSTTWSGSSLNAIGS